MAMKVATTPAPAQRFDGSSCPQDVRGRYSRRRFRRPDRRPQDRGGNSLRWSLAAKIRESSGRAIPVIPVPTRTASPGVPQHRRCRRKATLVKFSNACLEARTSAFHQRYGCGAHAPARVFSTLFVTIPKRWPQDWAPLIDARLTSTCFPFGKSNAGLKLPRRKSGGKMLLKK